MGAKNHQLCWCFTSRHKDAAAAAAAVAAAAASARSWLRVRAGGSSRAAPLRFTAAAGGARPPRLCCKEAMPHAGPLDGLTRAALGWCSACYKQRKKLDRTHRRACEVRHPMFFLVPSFPSHLSHVSQDIARLCDASRAGSKSFRLPEGLVMATDCPEAAARPERAICETTTCL